MNLKHFFVVTALACLPAVSPALAFDDSELLVEKGSWPLNVDSVGDYLNPFRSMTHIYRFHGKKDERLWLSVKSQWFPPVIVVHESGRFLTPFGLFVPPDGLPSDEYGRAHTLTFKIDGEWVTALEAHLEEDQDMILLVGRNPAWQANGQGFPVETGGALGGAYTIGGTRRE